MWQPPKLILMRFRYCTDSARVVSDIRYFVDCVRDFKAKQPDTEMKKTVGNFVCFYE